MSVDDEWIPRLFHAARQGKVVAGSPVPKSWLEGVHYTISPKQRFQNNEVVVVGRSDGSRSLGRIKPPKKKSHEWFQLEVGKSPEYYVDVGPAEAGGKPLHKIVEGGGLGKLHTTLHEVIAAKGEGIEEDDVREQMAAARENFERKYSRKGSVPS